MSTAARNRWNASLIVIAVGGIPFSFCLSRLGTDMASPELLRYALIATAPFVAILAGVALRFGSHRGMLRLAEVSWWSLLMCVPLEALTYLYSAWALKGRHLFLLDELPTLVVLLSAWAIALAIPSSLLTAVFPTRKLAR
jgi:hypothetical protein